MHRRADDIYVEVAAQPTPSPRLSDELAALLIPWIALMSTPAVASVGSPKLLLEVRDSAALRALRPDLPAIQAWGKEHDISGCYTWCRRAGRRAGRPELQSPGRGAQGQCNRLAAGTLTVLLGRSVDIHQGGNLGKPCLLRTVLRGGTALIGGPWSLRAGTANYSSVPPAQV